MVTCMTAQLLSQSPCDTPRLTKFPFECHVSVEPSSDPIQFAQACAELGVRAVFAHNLASDGAVVTELLTVSTGSGDYDAAWAELGGIADGLRSVGLSVVREKAEFVPWHHDAPVLDRSGACHDYFEAHLRIVHPIEGRDAVVVATGELGRSDLFVSWDPFKAPVDGTDITMITFRSYVAGAESFVRDAGTLYDFFSKAGLGTLLPLIVEWAPIDSNLALDARWAPMPAGLAA